MKPMFLPEVEHAEPRGPYAGPIQQMRAAQFPIPQIMHLFAYKPDATSHLSSAPTPRSRRSCWGTGSWWTPC
jgi:hypothetical protein